MQTIRAAFLLLACGLFLAPVARAADATGCPKIAAPNPLLWLARQCAKDVTGNAQCRAYVRDGDAEYIILKDCSKTKPQGYLLIPKQPVTGLEDSQIFSPALRELWQEGWIWSRKYPGMPEARTALAINSKNGRSQDQLHLHISCARGEVSRALAAANIPAYPAAAVTLELGPSHNRYQAVKVTSLQGTGSPFGILKADSAAMADLQDQSMAVIGAGASGEYYVLRTTADGANRGHAEELLDQTCARE